MISRTWWRSGRWARKCEKGSTWGGQTYHPLHQRNIKSPHPSLLLNLNTTSRHVKFPAMVKVSLLEEERGTKKVWKEKVLIARNWNAKSFLLLISNSSGKCLGLRRISRFLDGRYFQFQGNKRLLSFGNIDNTISPQKKEGSFKQACKAQKMR